MQQKASCDLVWSYLTDFISSIRPVRPANYLLVSPFEDGALDRVQQALRGGDPQTQAGRARVWQLLEIAAARAAIGVDEQAAERAALERTRISLAVSITAALLGDAMPMPCKQAAVAFVTEPEVQLDLGEKPLEPPEDILIFTAQDEEEGGAQ